MKLDDIAKMAIDEVSAELQRLNPAQLSIDILKQTESKEQEEAQIVSTAENHQTKEQIKDKSLLNENTALQTERNISQEVIFLKNLKERIEVLFDGFNEIDKKDIENRLEITLKFLEFILATVENRIENLDTKQ